MLGRDALARGAIGRAEFDDGLNAAHLFASLSLEISASASVTPVHYGTLTADLTLSIASSARAIPAPSFHDVRFPLAISLGATGGPERRTDVVVLGSGAEQRNQRWADSRRRYDAATGVRDADDLYNVLMFFEERCGKLYGFRWKDYADYKSCAPRETVGATDQMIGVGDGVSDSYQLVKVYGSVWHPYTREIVKPVSGSVRIAVSGIEKTEDVDWSVDTATGIVTFSADHVPASGAVVTAGFEFDVPVRLDQDALITTLLNYAQGTAQISVVEIRI